MRKLFPLLASPILALPLFAPFLACPSSSSDAPSTTPSTSKSAATAADAATPEAAATPAAAATPRKTNREAPPIHEATRAEAERALADLEAWVKDGATDPQNAWALAHGITAFGPELKASDGRLAIDVIVSDYVQKGADGWSFPIGDNPGKPIEPHKDLLIKTMLEAGVPQTRTFKLKSGKVTLRQIFEDAEKRFAFPENDVAWRDYAWSAYSMLLGNKLLGRADTKRGPITYAEIANRTVERLEVEQKFLEPLLGHPENLEKRRQGIYAHHCGGLHFVQAAVLGATTTKDPALIARVKKELDLVLFRWDAERRLYKETLWNEPKYRWLILVQELKFYGHTLETFALAREYGLFEPEAELSLKMRQIAGDLVDTTRLLEDAYRKDAMSQMPSQTQLDLIGDGCHAIRGLRKSLVAFFAN